MCNLLHILQGQQSETRLLYAKKKLMDQPNFIYISSERTYISYHVLFSKVYDMSPLGLFVQNLKDKCTSAIKVLIYYRNVRTVASVNEYFSLSPQEYFNGVRHSSNCAKFWSAMTSCISQTFERFLTMSLPEPQMTFHYCGHNRRMWNLGSLVLRPPYMI